MAGTRKIRWWPLGVIAVLAVAGLVWARVRSPDNRQDQLLSSLLVLLLTALLLLVWVLLLSRLRWKTRGLVLLAVMVAGVLFGAIVRVRGPSGNVMPVLEWRWTRDVDALPAPSPGPAEARQAPDGAADYPQFLGPSRDGMLRAPQLARAWRDLPPLWRIQVGPAWSGFAVVGPYAVTQEQRGEHELVTCYDLATGALVWTRADTARHDDSLGGPGPRATPTIADGRVFTQGATGILNALDLSSGAPLWSVNVLEDAGAPVPEYGLCTSPLYDDGRVVVVAGGLEDVPLLAYDAATGERVWAGGSDPAAYSSPLAAQLAGRRQILVFNNAAVAAHDPSDGSVLWRVPFEGVQRVSQPLPLPGDRLFVSAGYGVGGKLLQIGRAASGELVAHLVWESRGLKAKFTNVVHREGTLYGLDDGILVALDAAIGERRWKRGRYGHGQVILVDDLLLVQAEDGDVLLVEARPDEHRELARLDALDGRTWNHAALAGRYLVVRNDREAACFVLPVVTTP